MTVDIIVALSVAIIVFFVLVAVWYFVAVPAKRKALAEEARENAEKEAEVIKQKKLLEVKEKFLSKRTELEKEVRQHNQQIQQAENRIKQREMQLNQKQDELTRRKQEADAQRQRMETQQALLEKKEEEVKARFSDLINQERTRLEEISGLSVEEARERLIETLKDEAKTNAAAYINEIMDDARMTATKEAKRIIIQSIQRVATETAVENSVTVFHIDDNDVKGRIIGREHSKPPLAPRLSWTIRPKPSSSAPSTPSDARFADWLSTSSLATDAYTPHASRKWWQRSRSKSKRKSSKWASAPPSTSAYTDCTPNSSASSAR